MKYEKYKHKETSVYQSGANLHAEGVLSHSSAGKLAKRRMTALRAGLNVFDLPFHRPKLP